MKTKKVWLSLFTVAWIGCSTVVAQPKTFDRAMIPQPVLDSNPGFVDLYWTAWQQAWSHVKTQPGLVQERYMDEGLWDDTIWIWDSLFMALFCKYSPHLFPGIETLNNFYCTILEHQNSSLRIQHPDNPPFFAWVESEYYKMTDDKAHMKDLLLSKRYLQRYYDWFDSLAPGKKLHFDHAKIALRKTPLGYRWNGVSSGMDNTPRGYGKAVNDSIWRDDRSDLLWVDAIAQQALSALCLSRMAKDFGDKKTAHGFALRYDSLKTIVNKYYWDEADGTYYDIRESDTSLVKTLTPASFWPMLAEIPSRKQAQRMTAAVTNDHKLGGIVPWTTVSRDCPKFNASNGYYWRGAVWLPTAYMGIKALEKYGYQDLADETAYKVVLHQYLTYRDYEPHTIWECYSPTKPEPSRNWEGRVRADFCGWSALGPISLFIENILGFNNVDAQKRIVRWHKHQAGRHGIRNLSFGDITTDIMGDDSSISVTTNAPYTLVVNGRKYKIKKGNNFFKLK